MVVHPPSGASRHLPPQGRAIAYGISNTWAQLAEKFSNRNRLRTAIFESGEAGRRNNGIELLASSIRFFICDSPAHKGEVSSRLAFLIDTLQRNAIACPFTGWFRKRSQGQIV